MPSETGAVIQMYAVLSTMRRQTRMRGFVANTDRSAAGARRSHRRRADDVRIWRGSAGSPAARAAQLSRGGARLLRQALRYHEREDAAGARSSAHP
jgi:hypothetical protein